MPKGIDSITEAAIRGAADIANAPVALYYDSELKAVFTVGDRDVTITGWSMDVFVTRCLNFLRTLD